MHQPATENIQPILCTVNQGMTLIGTSRSKLYQEAKAGNIQFVKMDGSTRIFYAEIVRYIKAKAKPLHSEAA